MLVLKIEHKAFTAKSDSNDKKEYQIKRNKFGALIYRLKPAPYLNCNDLAERSLALQALSEFYSKHDPVKVVSLAGKTIQDAEMFEQLVDHRYLSQTPDVGVPPSDK
nr:hypothetical protein [Tanacetum cinerariifolium]